MRILQINCVYREGSTGKIVASIGDTLRAKGHEVFTCYGIGDIGIDMYSEKVCGNLEHKFNSLLSRITGIPYGGIFLSNQKIRHIITRFNPDVVHLHCINASIINVYSLLKYLAKSNIKTILTLHAEIFHTAGCAHAYDCVKWVNGCHHCKDYKRLVSSWFFDRSKISYKKMYDAIHAFSPKLLTITAVSPWLSSRVSQSAIMNGFEIKSIPNGVDISIFHYTGNNGLISRTDYDKIILFVTPSLDTEHENLKGGHFLPQIAHQFPNFKFVVVASQTIAVSGQLPANITLWGKAKSQDELAQLYSESDLTLLLSKRETFSMVTAESLCCGTPVIGFKAGGPESITIPEYSTFVEYGDMFRLKQAIISWTNQNISHETIGSKSGEFYSNTTVGDMFLECYGSPI